MLLSIPAALLRLKDLNAVSNSSIVQPELLIASLKDIKYCICLNERPKRSFDFGFSKGGAYLRKELGNPCILLRLVEILPQLKDPHS